MHMREKNINIIRRNRYIYVMTCVYGKWKQVNYFIDSFILLKIEIVFLDTQRSDDCIDFTMMYIINYVYKHVLEQ